MFRSSPRRNQRSKGFKVKHALQICLLLGVSIWLLYQLRNSRDKKASFGEGNKSVSEIAKLGRKDLQPQVEEPTIRDARHKEEENEEESKNEEEQNKFEESDDVVKGHGDGEIDVHDKDKVEEETEHRWDSVDGEKEKENEDNESAESKEKSGEEKENEENTEKGREGKESEESNEQSEEKENEESNEKEREVKAFEENKENEGENKGFEESKEKESKENENEESKEKQTEDKENEESKDKENEEIKENRSKEDQGAEKREGSNEIHSREEAAEKDGKIEERGTSEDLVQDGSDRNNKAREEQYKGDDAASTVVHNQNITAGSELGNWENSKDAEQVENRGNNDFEQESKTNSTEAVDANHNDSEKSVRETENFDNRDSTNATRSEDGGSESSQPELQNGTHANTTLQNVIPQETEKSEPAANNEQQNSSETPYTRMENGDVQTESNRSSVMDGNNDVILNTVNSADAGQNENDNADQSNTNNNTDAGQKEPVDSQEEKEASSNTYSDSNASQNDQVDSSISQEEKEARTDLETLPETTTQGHNNDDTAAE
ncbi:hypothetical protein I3843_07G038800 [Carya illinoinensis]|uniref:Uncharacterized protein n=1 Tax=Carya illinoinensis TaxID=32201 RepID=A0A922EF62_CARIL|nr:myb-like protein X [Carya illinoinensis]XP_042989277.1 myb-like protein X [Carya illinoinensis]KAG2695997.1 hypothetical protein I3760_07G038500 [Carya illinoinensis]KAG2695998.1 hypothetical protein I3760_07G038500 [Carya illinoinensis]KAG2695999.1 hypothetical protein I3760_07G038500 [Carya illinoinensis]KAG6702537.1 hypothetical protein I3842_07G039400 [Carya illinoinensis]KAG6702538.1 hypothetical protein I3842_07G039400 [Carya illinoinensis]